MSSRIHSVLRSTQRGIRALSRAVKGESTETFAMNGGSVQLTLVEALEPRVHLSYDDRGRISIIVDGEVAPFLTAELAQFEQDLIGDGWTTSLHPNAPRMLDNFNVWNNLANPPVAIASTTQQYRDDLQTVKNMIAADAADETLKAIVLVGHVTVPYSGGSPGAFSYDGHGLRAMPTDQYYGDLDGTPQNWGDSSANVFYLPSSQGGDFRGDPGWEFTWNLPGDGRFDADFAPGDGLELSFGRIDMANLGTAFASSEVDLLKAYFQRAHNYRTALFRPENKALVQTDVITGSPNFAAVLGSGNVIDGYWLEEFTSADPTHYLFASRTGFGALSRCDNGPQPFSSYNFGDAGLVGPPFGEDETPVHAVFTMVGGSFMGDWNNRSVFGTPQVIDVPLPRSLIAANFDPELLAAGNGEALVGCRWTNCAAAAPADPG